MKRMDPARARWLVFWREYRIFKREAGKAIMDALVFGRGFTITTEQGTRHAPRAVVEWPSLD